jgi:hypothetical protein
MRRLPSAVVVALAVGAGATPACHTDEPRRGDDAGALTAPAPPSPSTAPSTAAPTTGADGGVVVDAGGDGAGAVPVVDAVVDAGHLGDAPTAGAATTPTGAVGIGSPPPVKVDPITVTIFNRVLAKTKTRDLNPGQVQELAAQLTGQKVERARRTAGTFWLIQFAPTTPPRGKAEQQQLIAQLKAGGDFEFVEADQIMTVK